MFQLWYRGQRHSSITKCGDNTHLPHLENDMTEEQASEKYWKARDLLDEIIASGQRGSRQDILDELEDDLE